MNPPKLHWKDETTEHAIIWRAYPLTGIIYMVVATLAKPDNAECYITKGISYKSTVRIPSDVQLGIEAAKQLCQQHFEYASK